MNSLRIGAGAAAAILLASAASAQQSCLTTTFARGNGGGSGWVNCFDITVMPGGGITLETIDINTSANGVPANIEVYMVLNDTYVTNSTNPANWVLMSSGMGTAMGTGTPTPIDIADFMIPQGTHALGIHYVDIAPSYTNGNGSNQQYMDGTIQLDLGHSVAGLFSGTLFDPRVCNVTLCYSGGGGLSTYCTAKVNSLMCTPVISGTGSPSVSATSGFSVECAMVRNGKSGLLFYKVGGTQANVTFQCGTLCVGPSGIKRTPAQSAGGNPPPANDCSGVYSLDMNAFAAGMAGGNPDPALLTAGNLVHCQWWGRDQGFPSPCNTTLSDGGEYMTQP